MNCVKPPFRKVVAEAVCIHCERTCANAGRGREIKENAQVPPLFREILEKAARPLGGENANT